MPNKKKGTKEEKAIQKAVQTIKSFPDKLIDLIKKDEIKTGEEYVESVITESEFLKSKETKYDTLFEEYCKIYYRKLKETLIRPLVHTGNFIEAKKLLENSKMVGFPLIFVGLWVWWTTHYGGVKDLKELLKGGGDVNVNETNPDDEGSTPLFTAAEHNKVKCAELLIKKGANLETPDTEGRSPLWIAAQVGHKAMVQLLLDRGANVEAANKKGTTPLFIAVEYGHEDVVQLLLDRGANVGAENKKGFTPLTMAAAHGNDKMIEILLDVANVEAVNSGVLTPLFFAAKKGRDTMVNLLLDRGANVDAAAKDGSTPLFVAAEEGHDAVVQLLLDRGANVDAANNEGDTPLSIAAKKGHDAVVKILIKEAKKYVDQVGKQKELQEEISKVMGIDPEKVANDLLKAEQEELEAKRIAEQAVEEKRIKEAETNRMRAEKERGKISMEETMAAEKKEKADKKALAASQKARLKQLHEQRLQQMKADQEFNKKEDEKWKRTQHEEMKKDEEAKEAAKEVAEDTKKKLETARQILLDLESKNSVNDATRQNGKTTKEWEDYWENIHKTSTFTPLIHENKKISNSVRLWNDLTAEEQKKESLLGWDENTWNQGWWNDLTAEEKTAANVLGWDEYSWNQGESPGSSSKLWTELTRVEKEAATLLDYNEDVWNEEIFNEKELALQKEYRELQEQKSIAEGNSIKAAFWKAPPYGGRLKKRKSKRKSIKKSKRKSKKSKKTKRKSRSCI